MKVSALSRARTELTLLRERMEERAAEHARLCDRVADRDRHIEDLEKRLYDYEKEAVDNFSRINRLEREVKIHMDTIECLLRAANTQPMQFGSPARRQPFPDSPKTCEQTAAKVNGAIDEGLTQSLKVWASGPCKLNKH